MNKFERIWSDLRTAHFQACSPGRRMVRNHSRPLDPEIRIEEPFSPAPRFDGCCRLCGDDISDSQIYEADLCVICDDEPGKDQFVTPKWQETWKEYYGVAVWWSAHMTPKRPASFGRKLPTPERIEISPEDAEGHRQAYRHLTEEFFVYPKSALRILDYHPPYVQCRESRYRADPYDHDYVYAPEAVHVDLHKAGMNRIRRKLQADGYVRYPRKGPK